MDMSNLKKTIIRHEGKKKKLYKCTADKWTIGVGHNIEDNGLSEAAIQFIFEEDLSTSIAECQRNIIGWDEMPSPVQEALVNLVFNMGINRLMQFKKTLGYLRNGEFGEAAEELLDSRYARQVPTRAQEVSDMIRSCE